MPLPMLSGPELYNLIKSNCCLICCYLCCSKTYKVTAEADIEKVGDFKGSCEVDGKPPEGI